ncbi:MAG: hypothetical protein CMM01_16245 [Rhodopirellula sp.]|nr:hypothetical protein [Rhodopirellula sp.]
MGLHSLVTPHQRAISMPRGNSSRATNHRRLKNHQDFLKTNEAMTGQVLLSFAPKITFVQNVVRDSESPASFNNQGHTFLALRLAILVNSAAFYEIRQKTQT